MSDYENEDECWSVLESFRVKLISVIDPSRITPYLRQCKVLNPDDEEQVLSDPNLVIRKRKVGQCRLLRRERAPPQHAPPPRLLGAVAPAGGAGGSRSRAQRPGHVLAGVLLDILQRTGHKGYVAFLESLELYYPQLYKKVTGKEPTRVFSMIIGEAGGPRWQAQWPVFWGLD